MKILNLKNKHLIIYLLFFVISILVFINSNFYNQKKTSFNVKFTQSQLDILEIEKILLNEGLNNFKYNEINFDYGTLLPQNKNEYSYKKNYVIIFFHLNTLNIPITLNKFKATIKNQLKKNCNFFLSYKKNNLDKYFNKEISNLIKENNIKKKLLLTQFEFLSSYDFEFLNYYDQNYYEYLSIIEFFSKKKFNEYLDFKVKIDEILSLQEKKLIFEGVVNFDEKSIETIANTKKNIKNIKNQNFFFLIKEFASFKNILNSCLNSNLYIDTLEKNNNYQKKKLFLFFFIHIILILIIIFYRSKFINFR